jgi:hypothetical protein
VIADAESMWTELHGPRKRAPWGIAATGVSSLLFVIAMLLLIDCAAIANGESGISLHTEWTGARLITVAATTLLAVGGWRSSGGWLGAAAATGVVPVVIVGGDFVLRMIG